AWSFTKAVRLPEQIVNFGKVRVAYGESGQQPPLYATREVFSTAAFADFNPDIKPERVREVEAGVDLGLFRGRADLSVTRYDSKSKDVVFSVNLVPTT